jgi:2'-5' RNA ligase
VSPDNVHLTLRFLGEISGEHVADISSIMEEVARGFPPFTFSLRGLGAFPHAARPRVLWVGIGEGSDRLYSLQKQLEEGLVLKGFDPQDKDFKPHLTLARFKFPREEMRKRVYQACRKREKAKFGEMEATHVVLFESILSPRGAKYSCIKSVEFRGL